LSRVKESSTGNISTGGWREEENSDSFVILPAA
jgi:hypothetical protein